MGSDKTTFRLAISVLAVILVLAASAVSEIPDQDSLVTFLTSLSENDFAQPVGKTISPEWPSDAPDTVLKATVRVRIKRSHDGSVDSVESVYCSTPHLRFLDEALNAARKTVFAQSDSHGTSFPDWQYFTYQFWTPKFPQMDEFVPVETLAERTYFETPTYPRLAEMAGHAGQVWVKLLVDNTGSVRDGLVYKTSGHQTLDREALRVARKCKFEPAVQDGKPVATWVAFPYVFEL